MRIKKRPFLVDFPGVGVIKRNSMHGSLVRFLPEVVCIAKISTSKGCVGCGDALYKLLVFSTEVGF